MEALFLKLLNMSITASWLALAVILLRFLLKRAPKAFRVALWAMVAFRLVFPFSLESVFSLIPEPQPIPQYIALSPAPTVNTGFDTLDSTINPIISESFAPAPGDSANPLQIITAIAAVVWLVGLGAMVLYSLISYLYLRHKVKVSLLKSENIYFCDNIDTPFILGLIRPRIYLPSGISEADMEYVIQHERSHLKRKDHLWKPFGFALLSVYWFNPVLWLSYLLLCRDIELACDEKVIKNFDSHEKKGYSEALVSCSVHRRTVMACPLAFGEVGVKNRIKTVLNYKKPAFWLILAALIASIILGVCFLTDPLKKNEIDERLSTFLDVKIHSHYGSQKIDSNYRAMDFEVIGTEKNKDEITVYMWVMYSVYSYDSKLVLESSSHILTAITAKKVNDYYELVEYWEPRDGSYYDDDVKEKLPFPIWLKGHNSQRYVKKQQEKCYKMAEAHFLENPDVYLLAYLKNSYKELFSLDVSKGITVYFWQSSKLHYVCQVLEGKNAIISEQDFLESKVVPLSVTRAALWYYGIAEENVTLRSIRPPHASYLYEITDDSTTKLKDILWEEYDRDITPTDYIADELSFDIDNDGRIEYCYLLKAVSSHGTLKNTFSLYVLEDGVKQIYDYSIHTYFEEGEDKAFLENRDGELKIRLFRSGKDPIYYDTVFNNNGTISLELSEKTKPKEEIQTSTLKELKSKYPQYFGLSTTNGLEVFIWQTGDTEYFGGILPWRNVPYSNEILQSLKPASLEDLKLILTDYDIPRNEIFIHPIFKPSVGFNYSIDNVYCDKIQKLFWNEANVTFYPNDRTYDNNWGVQMSVCFTPNDGYSFEITLTHIPQLAIEKGKVTMGPDYEIKAIHEGVIMPFGEYMRTVKGVEYEDRIFAWDTVLYTLAENKPLTIEGTTKLVYEKLPKGEYLICKPITLEKENGERINKELTYTFYAY